MTEIQALDVRIPAEIIHNWGWFLVFGIGLALLGILAIVRSVAATVVSMLFFGWLLVIAAGIEIGGSCWRSACARWLSQSSGTDTGQASAARILRLLCARSSGIALA
jgi:uncharacterized membrane protein HdeD (DUF308 family)